MELRFDMMLYSNLGNKILMLPMSNVHVGCIWPAGSPPLHYSDVTEINK